MKRIICSMLLLMTAACSSHPPGKLISSNKALFAANTVNKNDVLQATKDNTAFAADFYQKAASNNGDNLFFSPYSLSTLMAMLYGGAQQNTASQMANAMHFGLANPHLNEAMSALKQQIQTIEGSPLTLNVVNDLWLEQNQPVVPKYLDDLQTYYGSGMHLEDFAHNPNGIRTQINDYIAQITNQKIQNLLPDGSIDNMTRMVLTNAVYFKGKWAEPFDPYGNLDFHTLDQNSMSVSAMRVEQHMNYMKGEDYQAVEIPYQSNVASMMLIVPNTGKFAAVETRLSEPELTALAQNWASTNVILTMPKFTFTQSVAAKQVLQDLGITDAFDTQKADFSGISSDGGLYVSDLLHKAFIAVDEIGTEAAAASAGVVGTTAAPMPEESVTLTVDRPFIFMIRDNQTGTILFLGRVMKIS